jgi:hypothetical protein
MFAYPNVPEFDPHKTQGLLNFARNGNIINGTQTWEITQIDPAFFAYLRNYTLVKLEISGVVPPSGGIVYINDHYVGVANASLELNEWDVPVEFCNLTTIIKVVSIGWDIKSVNLLFSVKFSQVPPWWEQNITIIVLAAIAETAIAIILARTVIKWIRNMAPPYSGTNNDCACYDPSSIKCCETCDQSFPFAHQCSFPYGGLFHGGF